MRPVFSPLLTSADTPSLGLMYIPGSEPRGIGLLFIETGADAASSAINRPITRIATICVTVSCWKHHRNAQCSDDAARREMKRQQAAAAAVV